MNPTEALNWRYSTKAFKPETKVPDDKWKIIENSLRLSASSTNSQPWHFVIASSEEGKKRMAIGTKGDFSFNTQKILDSSHTVLFCTKTTLTEEYLQHILEIEDQDGRFQDQSFKPKMHEGRSMFVRLHKEQLNDLKHWNEKQVYLNIGGALLTAATLKVDAVPMEGIDIKALNNEFDLSSKDLTASVMVCFGYRSSDDFNANLPKSRLSPTEIFTHL